MASIKDLKRMCESFDYCEKCVLKRKCGNPASIDEAVDEIVDKWVAEHPVKTYAMDFFEKFPNAERELETVEIVRCKDCKYYTNNIDDDCLRDGFCSLEEVGNFCKRKADDYCSRGELK